MFRDLDAGLMHAAIFWGFVILTVGTADRVTFGLIQRSSRPLLDGWLWRLLVLGQNMFVAGVLVAVGYALFRRLVWRYPRRTTLSRDGVVILLLIGGVVATEWFAEAFRLAAYGDPDAGWAVAALPLPAARRGALPAVARGGYGLFFWANVALVSFFLVYLPRSKHLHIVDRVLQCRAAQDAAAWRAAGDGPGGGRCDVRDQDDRRHDAGRTCSTGSRAPSAVAARRHVRRGRRASRSTPRR